MAYDVQANAAEVSILILGTRGKMGQLLYQHWAQRGARCQRESVRGSLEPIAKFIERSRDAGFVPIVVDFTDAALTKRYSEWAGAGAARWVIGTSGLSSHVFELLSSLSERTAIFWANNFSRGIAQISCWIQTMYASSNWECDILDLHHRHKVDSPSATAVQLANSWMSSQLAARKPTIASLRLGDGVSEHTVLLAGSGERIEIKHMLLDRKAFLPGIDLAVRLVTGRDRGLFAMPDLFRRDFDLPITEVE